MAKRVRRIDWLDDPKIEMYLEELGAVFVKKSGIPLTKIRLGDIKEQGRFSSGSRGVCQEVVDDFCIMLEKFGRFTKPILYPLSKKGKYDYGVGQGNHTLTACHKNAKDPKCQFGTSLIDAYVVSNNDMLTIQRIKMELNTLHGVRDDKENRLQNALTLWETDPDITMTEAAERQTVSVKQLEGLVIRRDVSRLLAELNVDCGLLLFGHLELLARLSEFPKEMAKLAKLITKGAIVAADGSIRNRMQVKDLALIIKRLAEAGSAENMRVILEQVTKQRERTVRAKRKSRRSQTMLVKFQKKAGALLNVLEAAQEKGFGITEIDKQEDYNQTVKRIHELGLIWVEDV